MFNLTTLTAVHVVISLVGIGAGFVVAYGLLANRRFEKWTAVFLATTIATSVSGFLFPADRFLPSHVFGVLSLALLGIAVTARYGYDLTGNWRVAYVTTAVGAFYLNFFVLIAQSFMKVAALKASAPTQSELPFVLSQLIALVSFAALGIVAGRRFRPSPQENTSTVEKQPLRVVAS